MEGNAKEDKEVMAKEDGVDKQIQNEIEVEEDLTISFSRIITSAQAKLRELAEKEKKWNELEERMKAHAEAAPKKITLDVGIFLSISLSPLSLGEKEEVE